MTVAELRDALAILPPDAHLFVPCRGEYVLVTGAHAVAWPEDQAVEVYLTLHA